MENLSAQTGRGQVRLKLLKCGNCYKSFVTAQGLKNHEKRCVTILVCPLESEEAVDKSNHQSSSASSSLSDFVEDGSYVCKHCMSPFPALFDLEEHIRRCLALEQHISNGKENSRSDSALFSQSDLAQESSFPRENVNSPASLVCDPQEHINDLVVSEEIIHNDQGNDSDQTQPLLCDHCRCTFPLKVTLEEHMKSCSPLGNIQDDEQKNSSPLTLSIFSDSTHAGSYLCEDCNALFLLSCDLEEHLQTCPVSRQSDSIGTENGSVSYLCEYCSALFPRLSDLEEHIVSCVTKQDIDSEQEILHIESLKKPVDCDFVEAVSSSQATYSDPSEQNLVYELDSVPGPHSSNELLDPVTVETCTLEGARDSNESNHESSEYIDTSGCYLNQQSVADTVDLVVHEGSLPGRVEGFQQDSEDEINCITDPHLDNKPLEPMIVDVCSLSVPPTETEEFTIGLDVRQDQMSHGEFIGFQCGLCDRLFRTKYFLGKHVLSHHTSKDYKCNFCDMEFKEYKLLDLHKLAVHKNYNRFHCRKCQISFASVGALKAHSQTHMTIVCDICRKKFSEQRALKTHIKRVHYKERNAVCSNCNYGFFNVSDLNRHLKTCLKSVMEIVKKQSDQICIRYIDAAKFNQSLEKKVNSKQNSVSAVLYKCKLCTQSFEQFDSLRKHISLHHCGQHLCDVCNVTFSSGEDLRNHNAEVHKMEEDTAPDYIELSDTEQDIYIESGEIMEVSEDSGSRDSCGNCGQCAHCDRSMGNSSSTIFVEGQLRAHEDSVDDQVQPLRDPLEEAEVLCED